VKCFSPERIRFLLWVSPFPYSLLFMQFFRQIGFQIFPIVQGLKAECFVAVLFMLYALRRNVVSVLFCCFTFWLRAPRIVVFCSVKNNRILFTLILLMCFTFTDIHVNET
jgi:hypothetical protein